MKTPSPTKLPSTSPRCSPTSPEKGLSTARRPGKSPTMKFNHPAKSPGNLNPLTVMGHSMINRSGDQETELNMDLRLITGRMAQTLHSYEDIAAKLYHEHIQEVEDHLDEIDSPILKVQIKSVLEDYKRLAMERENILMTLDKWFDNCSDEFMEELEELEDSLEGGDSLSGHIDQAKNIIAKIKFINHKIVEFQNNGMSTKKLIAQKKNLEDELMKKKIIVDNTQNGTEVLAIWKNRVENVASLIKNSEASEIEKALIDMQMSEAVDHINTHIISLEKTSRRTGVLFKTVKELEITNESLANENSFLKQRLSKLDKQFKDTMSKKVQKLDNALQELGDVRHLQSNGPGTTGDDVSRSVRRGGVSLEMELIDSYQEQIHVLDGENRDLISKNENLECEMEECKEELKTLELKLKTALKDHVKNTEIAAAHPLVRLDTADETYSLGTVSTTLFSEGSMSHSMSKNNPEGRRRNTVDEKNRRGSTMVSTITMQDGKELEKYKRDNETLRAQLGKMKNSLNTARRQSIKPRTQTKRTQTIKIVESDEAESDEESSEEKEPEEEKEAPPKQSDNLNSNKPRAKKKVKKVIKEEKNDTAPNVDEPALAASLSSELSDSSEEGETAIEKSQLTQEQMEERKKSRADSMVASLKSFVSKQERQKKREERKRRRESVLAEKVESTPEENDVPPPPASSSESDSEAEIVSEKKTGQTPAELAAARKAKQKKRKKLIKTAPKRKVKFEDLPQEEPEPEPPTFQRVPTPTVITEDPIDSFSKIKEEMREFMSYGKKFMNDIQQCLMETTDADIALTLDQYSEMEQKVMGLEMSLNILLYGVDLGMYLVTPTQARPQYSPLPFENKLYFQENLSKYLREKYPKLNVSALRLFDPELDPVKSLLPTSPIPRGRLSAIQPYPEYTNNQVGSFNNFMMPLTTTPEPPVRTSPKKIVRKKPKPLKREIPIGKIEEVIANLQLGTGGDSGKRDTKKLTDDRSFSEIVDQVMPKEMKLEYLKLIQPTHDTMGKKQYINKVKRGVMKVKDLLDLINLNSNQGVIKGLPSNSLGQPRTRQMKVHQTNLEVTEMLGPESLLATAKHQTPENFSYKNKLARYDERVRASLEDYSSTSVDDDLRASRSLTVMEVPLTSRTLHSKRSNEGKSGGSKTDLNLSTPREEMFDLSKSNPNMDMTAESDKRSFLPIVTQNLIPHFETKKSPQNSRSNLVNSRKLVQNLSHHAHLEQAPPKLSDLLSVELEKPKISAIGKLPKINGHREIDQNQSFP